MPRFAAAHVIFFLSGIAGLGYQFVWIRMFSVGLGHEMPSTLAVVAAFFAGLALGAWWFDRRSEPPDSAVGALSQPRRPRRASAGRTYAILEIIIGLWALATCLLIPWITDIAPRLIGVEPSPIKHWLIAFALPLVALLPATAAMGATLPAMERFVAPLTKHHRVIGGLYAANTLGALVGILLTTYGLAPEVGFRMTLFVLALVNLFCAAATVAVVMMSNEAEAQAETVTHATVSTSPILGDTHLRFLLFFTGVLGIAYEMVAVRVLNHVLQNTVYTYAATLCVYLLGTAIGAAMYQRFGAQRDQAKVTAALVSLLACAVMIGVALMSATASMYGAIRDATHSGDFLAEALVASRLLLIPTIAMGAMFSHLVQRAATHGAGVGRAAATNTLGAALGPALAIVALAATEDIRLSLYLIALGYWALAARFTERRWHAPLAITFVFALANGPQLRDLNLGIDVEVTGARLDERESDAAVPASPGPSPRSMHLISRRDGVMCSVAVVEARSSNARADRHSDQDYRILRINGQFDMGSTAPAAVTLEKLQGHIPLLLHPAPKRALFLGLGTGITFGTAALHPGLTADGVELVPEIVDALPLFAPHNNDPTRNPSLRVITADARCFVRATDEKYDVIVADLFHPSHDGAAMLYTVEHFQAIRERLNEGGVFVQWLPLHQMHIETFDAVACAFDAVFPRRVGVWADFNVDLPVLGLISCRGGVCGEDYSLAARTASPTLKDALSGADLRLSDELRFWGRFSIMDHGPTRPDRDLNRDDHPFVLFNAPLGKSPRRDELGMVEHILWLEKHRFGFPLQNQSPEAMAFASKLHQFVLARSDFIHGLLSAKDRDVDAAVQYFIASAAASPDFTLGYAHAVTLAVQAARDNPALAKSILQRLDAARPENPTARELLRRLGL